MKLRPYQNQAVKEITAHYKTGGRGFYLADETGIGKTPQALKVIQKNIKASEKKLVLIIVPAFLKGKWIEEIKKWLPTKRKYSLLLTTYSEIINPDAFRYYMKFSYDFLILDEAHYLKEFSSKRTMAIYGGPEIKRPALKDRAGFLIALSATPFVNRVGEIYTFLWAVKSPSIVGVTYETFLEKWAGSIGHNPAGITHKGIKNPEKFKETLKPGFLRRKKHDVLKDLPPGNRDFIDIPCTGDLLTSEKELLKELLELSSMPLTDLDTLLEYPGYLDTLIDTAPSFEKLSVFKKQQGLFKVKPILDYLRDFVLPENKKFLLFTYHRDTAKLYFEKLKKSVKNISLITGDIKPDDRLSILQAEKNKDQSIIVSTMGAIKEGFDLNEYTTSFFCEVDWTPYIFEQCEGRSLRFGQTLPVFWYYFILDRGVEKFIYKQLIDKRKTIQAIT